MNETARGHRRLRHGRRDAVRTRRGRAVLLALRPRADLPRADRRPRHRRGPAHARRPRCRRSRAAPPATRSRARTRCCATYPGTLGGKTGFTDAARHTFVTAAERDGRRLVVSVMDTENKPAARRRPGGPAARLGLRRPGRHRGRRHARLARGPHRPGDDDRGPPRRRARPPAAGAASRRTGAGPRSCPLALGGAAVLIVAATLVGRRRAVRPADGARSSGRRPSGGTSADRGRRLDPTEGRRPRGREEGEPGHQVDPDEQADGTTEGRRGDAGRRSATGSSRRSASAPRTPPRRTARRAAAGAAGTRPTARRAAATGR